MRVIIIYVTYDNDVHTEYKKARNWIADMTFDKSNSNINLFECTIRILGSLLSMFSLSGDEMYKIKAVITEYYIILHCS